MRVFELTFVLFKKYFYAYVSVFCFNLCWPRVPKQKTNIHCHCWKNKEGFPSPNLKVSGTPHFDTCPCIYIYVCVYVCVYVYVYVCICLCMYIYISIYTTCCFVTCVCYFYPVVCPIRNISYSLIDFLHMGRQPHFIRKHVPNQKLFHWRLHV